MKLLNSSVNSAIVKGLVDRMFANLRLLSERDAKVVIEEAIFHQFNPNESNLANYFTIIELLPQFIAAAGNDWRYILLQKLCRISWPGKCIVILSSALVECCQTEEDCCLAISKIVSYAKWTKNRTMHHQDVYSSQSIVGSYPERETYVDPEEMPILLHNLTSLSRKCENSDR